MHKCTQPERRVFLCHVFEDRRESVLEFFLSYEGVQDHEQGLTFFLGESFDEADLLHGGMLDVILRYL